MTHDEAVAKGYSMERASAFEVGLLYKGRGLRTWWNSTFGGEIPRLDHPEVAKAIQYNEEDEQL